MLEVRRILFPVDFSERCSAAASHVAAVAKKFHAKVTLLHVIRTPRVWYGDLPPEELQALIDIRELIKDRQVTLNACLQDEFRDVADIERIVERGEPARVIAEHARKDRAHLIMMPTHGYGPFRRMLLGSITAKVLHDAECPVWTDVHDEISFARLGCQSVICAVDLREEMVSAIQWAAAFAASFGADLTLVHAIPALAGPARPSETRFRSYLVESAREYIADLQQRAGTAAAVCIQGGRIAQAVRTAAVQSAAELVVIGQGCIHETLGRLRSNAYAIIRESPCPVVRV
ncbi:MAG: universal stress protein [Acidobacteriia bacterium]|nr:universal stress protein [Terriglobia bacterium]